MVLTDLVWDSSMRAILGLSQSLNMSLRTCPVMPLQVIGFTFHFSVCVCIYECMYECIDTCGRVHFDCR